MREIRNIADGEVIDTILIFQAEEERESYFKAKKKQIEAAQADSLAKLRRAYMQTLPQAIDGEALRRRYQENIKKTFALFARSFAMLRIARAHSLLEEEIAPPVKVN